jgi:hypothetical protein
MQILRSNQIKIKDRMLILYWTDNNKPCWKLDDKGEDSEDKAETYTCII